MKLFTSTIIIVNSFLIATTVFGEGPAVQHQFKGGDPASATQVNENFQELADRIQDNKDQLLTYDYHDYLTPPNITSKTFSVTPINPGSSQTCLSTQETRNYDRAPQGSDTLVTVSYTQYDTSANQTCSYYSFQYLSTSHDFTLQKQEIYDPNDTNVKTIQSQYIYNEGLPVLTSDMRAGSTWGSISTVAFTDNLAVPPIIDSPVYSQLWQFTLLAIEDVTVPYDGGRGDNNPTTYPNCLKISKHRFYSSGLLEVEWFCPSIGFVKRMRYSSTILLTGVN